MDNMIQTDTNSINIAMWLCICLILVTCFLWGIGSTFPGNVAQLAPPTSVPSLLKAWAHLAPAQAVHSELCLGAVRILLLLCKKKKVSQKQSWQNCLTIHYDPLRSITFSDFHAALAFSSKTQRISTWSPAAWSTQASLGRIDQSRDSKVGNLGVTMAKME